MGTGLHSLELIVELDPLREPISGRVTDARGRRRTFSGWLDLMEVLDGARHGVELRTGSDARPRSEVEDPDRQEEPE
jgi:hypothetical protein